MPRRTLMHIGCPYMITIMLLGELRTLSLKNLRKISMVPTQHNCVSIRISMLSFHKSSWLSIMGVIQYLLLLQVIMIYLLLFLIIHLLYYIQDLIILQLFLMPFKCLFLLINHLVILIYMVNFQLNKLIFIHLLLLFPLKDQQILSLDKCLS